MVYKITVQKVAFLVVVIMIMAGCKSKSVIKEKEIVKVPEKMDDQVRDNIRSVLVFARDADGKINKSSRLAQFPIVNAFYEKNNFKGVWSTMESWNPVADSMFAFLKQARYYGLYPEDYHYRELDSLRQKIATDSLAMMDAVAWTNADLMLSDAFFKTLKDLKEGRIVADSLSIVSKANYLDSFFLSNLDSALRGRSITGLFTSLEPDNSQYRSLRTALRDFADSMDHTKYIHVDFPYKDTLAFYEQLHARFLEEGLGDSLTNPADSVAMSREIKKYQAARKLTADGKAGEGTVASLNLNDNEKFLRIAITLDRYKSLTPMPESYIWVNIPGFYLRVWDHDTVALESRVVVGKPLTRTPLLVSAISNMVIYPNWTIPESIIKKEILPALKADPGYLARKGFSLVDDHGEEVDPYSVKWSKYKNGIPWRIVQGSGDDNTLGIFKFNFNNPYSVYLHDTNQRYLFGNKNRALSHGCVRVQKWMDLAFYIARNDSSLMKPGKSLPYNTDSLLTWISRKERKTVMLKNRLPLYIEYFTCEARDGRLIFYNDVYNEDNALAVKYFPGKL